LNLFFSKDWQPVSHAAESRSYILNNIYTDHVSFGHDIETAYLLIDAAQTLYGKADSITLQVARKLTDHSLQHGFDKNYYGLFDKGYYFKDKDGIEIVNDDKVWWSQAEAWHSLAIISNYYPQEKIYPLAFGRMWTYINEQMIDRQFGGWYNNGLDSDPGNRDKPKGHQWKACYHNGRALMRVYQYAKKQKN
jgi:mannobiose 2-epimerase